MSDEQKPLTGKSEQVVRAVERTLAAERRREQPGVKITNLASGKTQVEVHAYDDDVRVAGDAARAEFDRQLGTTSVPNDELEKLRWYASIGMAMQAREPDATTKAMLEERDTFLAEVQAVEGTPHDIQAGPGHRTRKSVQAVGDTSDDLLAKLRAVTDGENGDARAAE